MFSIHKRYSKNNIQEIFYSHLYVMYVNSVEREYVYILYGICEYHTPFYSYISKELIILRYNRLL